MRIIHAEDPYTALGPEEQDITQFVPEGLPAGIVVVERVDVLVFLGRILGVLDRAVRAVEEPFGMILHVGMVRGAVQCEVERYLHAACADLSE